MDAPGIKSKADQDSSQTFPYSVTLMDASTTSVIQVISQVTHGAEDLSTEDKELKYLTPVVNPDIAITKEATPITGTARTVQSADLGIQDNLKQPTSVPAPSFTSDTSASPGTALTPSAFPLVTGTTLDQSVGATLPPTSIALPTPPPSTPVFNTNTTIVDEDSHLIPSNADNNVEQFDIVPTLATVVTESNLETPALSSILADASGTSMVSLDDLEVSVPGVMKKVGSGLNFTNMTTSTTGTSRPTLEPSLAEGAATIDTPFLSFSSSTSILLAVVIGFGLIMG